MSSTLSMSCSGRTRHNNMHEFIKAVEEYCKDRTDEACGIINRHLQLFSVSIDTSIFDPNTSVVCEFFVSLYELLNVIEPRSTLAWGCINVLVTACKNPAARHSLIHTYQFIPLLARLLGDHLLNEKKIRLLHLMQELSCGLRISWIIPNLEHLMLTLTRWVLNERGNEDIVLLSLGLIVNLCYKNLPAMYILSKCVDIKSFLRVCASLQNNIKLEACTCKLFIIHDSVEGMVPESTFIKLLHVTFSSIQESFLAKDPIVLRQNVEFYLDVKAENENLQKLITSEIKNYEEKLHALLLVIKNNANAAGDHNPHDPECMSLVFKFIRSFVELNLPQLEHHYESITQIALHWVQTDLVSTDALYVLRGIACACKNTRLLELLLSAIPLLTLNLQTIDGETIMNIENCKRLIAVMDLLKTLVESSGTRERVMVYLSKETLTKVFALIFGDLASSSPRERANDANNYTPEAFSLYINTLSLISVITLFYPDWSEILNDLLRKKQIHAIVAEGICNGDKAIRCNVFKMIANVESFPCEAIANTMSEVWKFNGKQLQSSSSSVKSQDVMCYPLLTSSHSTAPNEAIRVLNEARQSQRINVSTCDVMELYEYKIATMGHAERAAMASVEAASQRCTHLQHQTAQLTAELSRIRQLFLHTQKKQKESEKKIFAYAGDLKGEQVLRKKLQEKLETCSQEFEKSCRRIDDLQQAQKVLEAEKAKALDAIPPLRDTLKKLEKNCEYKEEVITAAKAEIECLKSRLQSTEMALKATEHELQNKSKELNTLTSELDETRTLLDAISKLTNTRYK